MNSALSTLSSRINALSRNTTVGLVLFLTAIFALLRFIWLGQSDLSIDESFSALYAGLPWKDLVPFISENDIHPPLYFAFTKLFSWLGDSAAAYRVPAAIAGVAALPVIYVAGTAFGRAGENGSDRVTGLLALVLAGLSSTLIAFSQNARAYSVLFLGFSLILAGAALLASRPDRAGVPLWSRSGSFVRWSCASVAAGMLLLLWSHNIGVIYTVASAIMLVVLWLTVLGASRAAFINLAVTAAVVAGGWVPHVLTLLQQWGSVSSDYWIQAPTAVGAAAILAQVLGDMPDARSPEWDEVAFAVLAFGIAVWAVLRMLRFHARAQVVVGPLFLVIAAGLLLGVTYLARPVLLDRTALPLAAPFILVLASGVAVLSQRRYGTAAIAIILVAAGISTLRQIVTPNEEEPWRRIVATVAGTSDAPSLVITLPNSAAVPLAYHARKQGAAIDILPLPGPFPTRSPTGRYPTGWPGVPAITPESLDLADARIAEARGDVWLLLRGYWTYDPDALLRAHFDRAYCYQPLYLRGIDYFFLLRLIPKATGRSDCVSYEPHRHYPFRKPDDGLVQLAQP